MAEAVINEDHRIVGFKDSGDFLGNGLTVSYSPFAGKTAINHVIFMIWVI
jgi:hypothetical protein